MRSDVELFDGLEFINANELRSTVIVNYKLTRDMPMREYQDMLSRLRDHWVNSGYKTVHICVNRKSQTPETLREKQSISRCLRNRVVVNKPSIDSGVLLQEIHNHVEELCEGVFELSGIDFYVDKNNVKVRLRHLKCNFYFYIDQHIKKKIYQYLSGFDVNNIQIKVL